MKMQMHGQSLRVRISEAELARLQDGKTVGNVTRMPGGVALRHEAKLVEEERSARTSVIRMRVQDDLIMVCTITQKFVLL